MKAELFAELQEAVRDVAAYRRGERKDLKVARFAKPKRLGASEIRKLRKLLRLSQPMFALYLGTSAGCVRSWEQGKRKPRGASLRLLSIVRNTPAALLEIR